MSSYPVRIRVLVDGRNYNVGFRALADGTHTVEFVETRLTGTGIWRRLWSEPIFGQPKPIKAGSKVSAAVAYAKVELDSRKV